MRFVKANPILGWLLVAAVLLHVTDILPLTSVGFGAVIAACFYPSRPDEPLVY